MLYSMTGFGRSVVTDNNHKITVEAKSLNSKQLDVSLRVPSVFREVEMTLRDKLSKKLERGKVDVNVFVETIGEDRQTSSEDMPRFNLALLRQIKNQIEGISRDLSVAEPSDWFQIFMRFPDVLHTDRPQPLADNEEIDLLEKALTECVDALLQFRRQEGATLEVFFRERLINIANLLQEVEKYEAERVAKIKERIEEGLKKVAQVEHDKNRLEQELIFYIEKLDISEEKQRLAQHIRYFDETMNNPSGGQGKKLGFIAQEMGREINTLGSKSNHAEMQKIVVRMKDELEQIKEQVLNVL